MQSCLHITAGLAEGVLAFKCFEYSALRWLGQTQAGLDMSKLKKRLNSVFVFVIFLFSCTRLAFTRIWPFQQASQKPPSVKVFALTEAAWLELRAGGAGAAQDKSGSKSGDDKKEPSKGSEDKKERAKGSDCDKGGSKSSDDKKDASPSADDKKKDAPKSGECNNSGPGGGDGDTGGGGG